FLLACAEDNMQVAYPSTPAQYFHLLRRQIRRDFRKPLIVMTPKSMLRLKAAQSPLEQLISGRFQEVLDDPAVSAERAKRLLLCSGKIYYELVEARARAEAMETAIIRLEQFYPFPEEQLRRVLDRYRKAQQLIWVQEESQNMGGWSFVEPRLRAMGPSVDYVGRDASASPATGSLTIHKEEQKELVEAAIHGPAPCVVRAGAVVRPPTEAVREERAAVPAKK